MVKPAPRLATILCRWFGRLAMPIGEALSAAGGAISTGFGRSSGREGDAQKRMIDKQRETAERRLQCRCESNGRDQSRKMVEVRELVGCRRARSAERGVLVRSTSGASGSGTTPKGGLVAANFAALAPLAGLGDTGQALVPFSFPSQATRPGDPARRSVAHGRAWRRRNPGSIICRPLHPIPFPGGSTLPQLSRAGTKGPPPQNASIHFAKHKLHKVQYLI